MAKYVFVLICTLIINLSVLTPLTAFALTVSPKTPPLSELGGFSITPTIGGYLSSGSGALNSSLLYGVKIGYVKLGPSLVDSLGAEGTMNFLTTTSQSDNGTANGYLFRVDALYPFKVSKKVMPFLAVGLGGIYTSTASHSELRPLLNYGPGLKYFLEDYLAVRVDVRHLLVYRNVNTHNNFEASIGLSYFFGKERKKKPALLPAPKPPVKAIHVPVLKQEETVPIPVTLPLPTPAAPIAPVTSTKIISLDGNVLVQSLTPTTDTSSTPGKSEVTLTPGAMIVVQSGQALPSPAPASPAGLQKVTRGAMTVVQSGQALPSPVPASPAELQKAREAALVENELQSLRILTVEFDLNHSDVKPKYDQQFKEITALMKAYPGSAAKIEGHADSSGKKNFNSKLSLKRANSVKSLLMKFGVSPARISTVGYGSSQAIADNTTEQGRQKNRRAVTTITVLVPPPNMDLLSPPSKPDDLSIPAPAMPAGEEVGTVIEISGKVIIERGGPRMTARKKSRIQAGDIIETAAKSRVKLLFNDQSTLTLGEMSRLVVKDFLKRKGTEGSSLKGG